MVETDRVPITVRRTRAVWSPLVRFVFSVARQRLQLLLAGKLQSVPLVSPCPCFSLNELRVGTLFFFRSPVNVNSWLSSLAFKWNRVSMVKAPSKLLPEHQGQEVWAGTHRLDSRLSSSLLGAAALALPVANAVWVSLSAGTGAISALQSCRRPHPRPRVTVLTRVPVAGTPELSPAERKELEAKLKEREEFLSPIYHQVAMQFADLHDTPGRMQEKGAITVSVTRGHRGRVRHGGRGSGRWDQLRSTSCHGDKPSPRAARFPVPEHEQLVFARTFTQRVRFDPTFPRLHQAGLRFEPRTQERCPSFISPPLITSRAGHSRLENFPHLLLLEIKATSSGRRGQEEDPRRQPRADGRADPGHAETLVCGSRGDREGK